MTRKKIIEANLVIEQVILVHELVTVVVAGTATIGDLVQQVEDHVLFTAGLASVHSILRQSDTHHLLLGVGVELAAKVVTVTGAVKAILGMLLLMVMIMVILIDMLLHLLIVYKMLVVSVKTLVIQMACVEVVLVANVVLQ
jgi:hypothetical protein